MRTSTVDRIWQQSPRAPDGRPIDPNTRRPIDGRPDIGHRPEHEFRRERSLVEQDRLSQQEFNERMNDPHLYQLEEPLSNRCHRFEPPDW
ncbi:MAG: HNH/ENDO VII family nuclease [Candidatus Riflebacteria bacterium]|nr:HNH/ENDO VII family nuclease [Candidatus Riflebacteria bacterium]